MKNKERDREAEEKNPCLKEQELTFKCYDNNNYNKEACQMEIENYKLCKAFWYSIKKERRRKGIYPLTPPLDEREAIKKEYFHKFKP